MSLKLKGDIQASYVLISECIIRVKSCHMVSLMSVKLKGVYCVSYFFKVQVSAKIKSVV